MGEFDWVGRNRRGNQPTASFKHFLVKLFFAAPSSFFSDAAASQVAVASFSHFVRNEVLAAGSIRLLHEPGPRGLSLT